MVPFTFNHKLGGSAEMERPPSLTIFEDESNCLGTLSSTAVAFHATQDPITDADAPNFGASASVGVQYGMTVRRLTPLERERLMGWPDGWTEWGIDEDGQRIDMTDTVRDRMTGNGVVSPVAAWIAARLLAPATTDRAPVPRGSDVPDTGVLSERKDDR